MTTADERKVIEQQFKQRMDEEELLNCMRCGFCLPSCPTYIESGFQESHSPRGRIALMKAVVDGRSSLMRMSNGHSSFASAAARVNLFVRQA